MSVDANTRRVMIERRHGWEEASAGLLARVFDLSVQQVNAICAQRCHGCGRAVCGCPDPVFAGVAPSPSEVR